MSYSRWSNSSWYCFWRDTECNTKENEVLALWLSIDKTLEFTYEELKNFTAETIIETYDVCQELADEAMGYIKWFLEDVDKEYTDMVNKKEINQMESKLREKLMRERWELTAKQEAYDKVKMESFKASSALEGINYSEEVSCKDHPDAPHGFDRDSSHAMDRYVCECESWEPEDEIRN